LNGKATAAVQKINMANARIPGPQGAHDQTGSSKRLWALEDDSYRSGSSHPPGPVGVRAHRPIRVADAEGKDAKKPGKKTSPPPADKTVHLHFYLDPTDSYSATSLVDFIRGPEDYVNPLNRWDQAGIKLVSHTNVGSGADDFKKSLQDEGAVVVYLGHSALDFKNKRSMGLTPKGSTKPEIAPDKLMDLLKQSKTSLVTLASCASSTLVGKMTGGPAVVVTNSQANLTTWSNDWANALGPFLLVLLGYNLPPSALQPTVRKEGRGKISDALDAANAAFKSQKTDDRFELANGDTSTVIFPEN
jgi:hypothetical protein